MACGRVCQFERHHRPISGRVILAMGRSERHASYSDIAAAIPAPAQAGIRADPSRKEALRKQYQLQAQQERQERLAKEQERKKSILAKEQERLSKEEEKLGEVRIATGTGGPARARSEAEI